MIRRRQIHPVAQVAVTGVVSLLIAYAFVVANPPEQSLERLCVKTAPNLTVCRRL